jgi:hypothetical protein
MHLVPIDGSKIGQGAWTSRGGDSFVSASLHAMAMIQSDCIAMNFRTMRLLAIAPG